MSEFVTLLTHVGSLQETNWEVEGTFLSPPGIFRFIILHLEIPDKTKLHP